MAYETAWPLWSRCLWVSDSQQARCTCCSVPHMNVADTSMFPLMSVTHLEAPLHQQLQSQQPLMCCMQLL